MTTNEGYTFSWERENNNSSSYSKNQVAPDPHGQLQGYSGQYGQPTGSTTQYGMDLPPLQPHQSQQPQQPMQQPVIQQQPMHASQLHPFGNPRCYDANGDIIIGTFKWAHDPSEGPYRPFATEKGKHGATVSARVMSKTQEELSKELDSTASELCCATFWCYFISAFQGIKHLKRAREYSSKGQDIEARDALLDAKISYNRSCFLGGVVCWGILQGIFVMLLLPFIWIPYLIVIA